MTPLSYFNRLPRSEPNRNLIRHLRHNATRQLLLSTSVALTVLPGTFTPATAAAQGEPSVSWPLSDRPFLQVEESAAMRSIVYRYGQVKSGSGGCYFTNCGASRARWKVEWQRLGFRNVVSGVLQHNPSLVRSGLDIFAYAFRGEAGNGSFPGSAGPFHGTAMFLAEAAPALIVLKYSAMEHRFARVIAAQTASIDSAATYVYRHGRFVERIDGGATDRFFEAALALEASGILSGNGRLVAWSRQYARGGINRTRPSGLMPEWSGHDVYYQALGLVDACRYLLMIGPGISQYQRLYAAIAKGMRWEAGRVSSNGEINASGDVRSKTPFPYSVVSAFARWSVIGHDHRYAELGRAVWSRYYS